MIYIHVNQKNGMMILVDFCERGMEFEITKMKVIVVPEFVVFLFGW